MRTGVPDGKYLQTGCPASTVQNLATTKFPQQHYYASNITYTPASDVSSMAMGNGVTEQFSWNDRLQLTGITAGRLRGDPK